MIFFGLVVLPGTLMAHPGHGVVDDPIVHHLLEPAHLIPTLAILAGAWAIARVRRHRRK
jgi:hypothetical protein